MTAAEAGRKERLAHSAVTALRDIASAATRPSHAYWVPGRVEFLGKHTDYAGGRSLLCAAERGIVIVAAPRPDSRVRMRDGISHDTIETDLAAEIVPRAGHWSNYPLTVARRMVRNFPGIRIGADIAFASDLPIAAGMSSSSALVIATFLALAAVNAVTEREDYRTVIRSDDQLAGYLGTTENGLTFGPFAGEAGVGTFGGSEDQTAILCSEPRALVQYSFCPVRFERTVPLPRDHVLVIASSGVVAEKTGAALEHYNRLSSLAREAREQLGNADARAYETLAAAVFNPERSIRDRLATRADLAVRAEQFALEANTIIPAAGAALERGDLAGLGALVDRSQRAAEQMLGNQIPETEFLAKRARELGAVAASAFGAGFGGSVWALARESVAEEFSAQWRTSYAARFPQHAAATEFFPTHAGPHAMSLPVADIPGA